MRIKHFLVLSLSVPIFVQAVYAQGWGQLKSAANEAQAAMKFDEANDYWNKALNLCEDKTGPRYIQSLAGLAACQAEQGKLSEAEGNYKKIAELAKNDHFPEDGKAALEEYACFLRKQKREGEASDLESKYSLLAKDNTNSSKPNSNSSVDVKSERELELKNWQSLITQADKEMGLKHYAQSEQLCKQALAIAEKLGDNTRVMSETLSKLILLCYSQNNFAAADPYYLRSMDLTRKTSGSGSKNYANALNGHGQLLRKLNRKTEAMSEEAKADAILAKFNRTCGGSSGPGYQGGNDPSGTRRGSVMQRAQSAQRGFDGPLNQMINSPE